MPNNTVEFNGKRYDAISGRFLGPIDGTRPAAKHSVKSVDGVLNASPKLPRDGAAASKTAVSNNRPVASFAGPHQIQHSKTLMRQAVTKPDIAFRRHHKPVGRADLLAKQPSFKLSPRLSYNKINKERLEHAKKIAKSQLISKFSPQLGVVEKSVSKPKRSTEAPRAYLEDPAQTSQPMDIFEQAIASAGRPDSTTLTGRRKTKLSKRSSHKRIKKLFGFGSTALLILLVLGFIAYQFKANIIVKIASSRAGFEITTPGDLPNGYSFSSVNYGSASAALTYVNGSNSLTLTQKVSNWDTETLLNSYVSPDGQTFSAYKAAGRTVFVIGNKATWVDQGIWYVLDTHGQLSNDQMVEIAATL